VVTLALQERTARNVAKEQKIRGIGLRRHGLSAGPVNRKGAQTGC